MILGLKDILRNKLEQFSHGKIIWRRLPEEFGRTPILLSPDARLQHLKPGRSAFDEGLIRLAVDYVKKDSVVWDVGANVGVFSMAAASIALNGAVLAIEPDPWLAGLVQKSCEHSENQNLVINVLSTALSNTPGTARLVVAERGRASNYLEEYSGRSQTGGERQRHIVPVLTLDLLAESLPAPSLIKIDVEGAEWAVLQGGKKMIESFRPIIAIEVGKNTSSDVSKFLLAQDYELLDLNTGKPVASSKSNTLDILALPR